MLKIFILFAVFVCLIPISSQASSKKLCADLFAIPNTKNWVLSHFSASLNRSWVEPSPQTVISRWRFLAVTKTGAMIKSSNQSDQVASLFEIGFTDNKKDRGDESLSYVIRIASTQEIIAKTHSLWEGDSYLSFKYGNKDGLDISYWVRSDWQSTTSTLFKHYGIDASLLLLDL